MIYLISPKPYADPVSCLFLSHSAAAGRRARGGQLQFAQAGERAARASSATARFTGPWMSWRIVYPREPFDCKFIGNVYRPETVAVPISEDEGESPSKRSVGTNQAKKRQAQESTAAAPQAEGVSLKMLQQLFQNQTRELREAQKLESARALGQVQLEVRKSIGELRDDLRTVNVQMAGFSVRMDDFEKKQSDLEDQPRALQMGSMASMSVILQHRRPARVCRESRIIFETCGQYPRRDSAVA